MRLRSIAGVVAVLLLIIQSSMLLLAQQPISTPQDEEPSFNVYRDRASLTIVFTEAGEVAFNDILIDVFQSGTTPSNQIELTDHFLVLNMQDLETPACLRIVIENSQEQLPSTCTNLPNNKLLRHSIHPSDRFWYNSASNTYYDLAFYQGETSLGICPQGFVVDQHCEVILSQNNAVITPTVLPTATTTLTAPATATETPTRVQSNTAPVITSATTSNTCPMFNAVVQWQDAEADIVGFSVGWGPPAPQPYTQSYPMVRTSETSGTWQREIGLSCVAPRGGGCFVQFQAIDARGNRSNTQLAYNTCQ